MPSQLIGLFRKLTWADFGGTPPAGTPFAAATFSSFTVSNMTFRQVAGSRDFQLVDQLTITVTMNQKTSWRIPMDKWPAQAEQDLLDHEQGHYDITALNARDGTVSTKAFSAA